MKLVSPKVNSAEVTVNTLFAFPKPHVLTLTSPRGEQTIAYLQSNGTYLTETGSRPRIVQGTIVKNEMRFEDMQLAVENVYMQT